MLPAHLLLVLKEERREGIARDPRIVDIINFATKLHRRFIISLIQYLATDANSVHTCEIFT